MRKKKWHIAAALLALGILAGLCVIFIRGEDNKTLELGVFVGSNWGVANADSNVIIDKAIEKFEKENQGIKVHYYSGIPKDEYSEWLTRKALQGEMPDVFMVLSNDLERMVSLGLLADLDEFMEKDPSFHKTDYFSTALASGQKADSQYALPYETVPTLMFANKTLLHKEGFGVPENDWDWEQLTRICERITKDTDGDGRVDQFGTYNYSWREAVYSNGGKLFDEDGSKCYINSEQVSEAVKFVNALNDFDQGEKVTQEDFDSGNVAFMPLSFAEYRTYKTYPYKIKKYTNFQWDCITLPAGPQGRNSSEVDSLLVGVSDKSRKKELAWEFLKTLTYDEEIQIEIFRHSQGVSALKSVTGSAEAEQILKQDMEESDKVIDNEVLSSVIENGMVTPRFAKYEDALALAEGEVLRIYEGGKNVENSLKLTQRTIEHFLTQ